MRSRFVRVVQVTDVLRPMTGRRYRRVDERVSGVDAVKGFATVAVGGKYSG